MEEAFIYENCQVKVETVQPLFAEGWLWRITLNGQLQIISASKICKEPEQALLLGVGEARSIIDADRISGTRR